MSKFCQSLISVDQFNFFAPAYRRQVFASLRAKIKMLENEPSLLARAIISLLPCGLKKAINFRSPQKTQVTCH
jgi:hypothetical protein